jgi:hypothetical protein
VKVLARVSPKNSQLLPAPYLIWVPAVIRFSCVFTFFGKKIQSSKFSDARFFSGPTFSHFVTNLDRLAGQPFQIFLACQILDPDFLPDFPCIPM